MFKWHHASLILPVASVAQANAQDELTVRETEWIKVLSEQVNHVSENEKRFAIMQVVVTLAETGRDAEAREIAVRQPVADTKNSMLAFIAAALGRQALFDKALEQADQIADPAFKEKANFGVAIELAKHGQVERAERLVSNMQQSFNRDRVIVEICARLAMDSKYEEAASRASKIEDLYLQNEATKSIERQRTAKLSPLDQLSGSLKDRVRMLAGFSAEGKFDSMISAILAARAGDRNRALELIKQNLEELDKPEILPKKVPMGILAAVALTEAGEDQAAGELIERLDAATGRDWTGFSSLGGTPILMSLLVRLKRFETIDKILERKSVAYQANPTSSSYLFTLSAVGESLTEYQQFEVFDKQLARCKSADEKLYILAGALVGANYARQNKR